MAKLDYYPNVLALSDKAYQEYQNGHLRQAELSRIVQTLRSRYFMPLLWRLHHT
jgi:hypothetical protein